MPAPTVAVLLVSHDGARWLPTVLDGLAQQRRAPDRRVAVDTGSKDASPDLLEAAGFDVRRESGRTHYPAAVDLGLERIDTDWVWLLHDDATPAPGALEALLAAAAADPAADVLGPKLREWPSLRRLLEVGVTLSGTGTRETGLERGEYDQGQHDDVRRVLAVNTAGMLVRRSVLVELGGFDEHLPIFGNDIDFGWRVAAAGHTTVVVPQAVVFHAEAAHRGVRRTPITGRHTHYQERRAALYTLLANAPAGRLPFQLVRLGVGSLLRVVGFLLVRSVGEALDELAALVSVYSSPREVLAARRRRTGAPVPGGLLAPWWLPYRHGLDVVTDLAAAATDQAADVAERRRAAAAEREPASAPRRPVVDDSLPSDELLQDTGLLARWVTDPVVLLLAAFVVIALVGARDGFGAVTGPGLSPVPEGAGDWWALHLEGWHELAQGTPVPAPAYVLPLALLALPLGPGGAVSALLVLAVPLSLWGAWRFLRVVGRLVSTRGAPRWLVAWGATTYALLPVLGDSWGEGRLGTVVTAITLPWLAHAALGFADPEPDRRWRAAWRVALLLALVTAFSPVSWILVSLVTLVVLAIAAGIAPSAMRDRAVWAPPLVAVATVSVLLAPWWLPALLEGAAAGLLLDAGPPPAETWSRVDLLSGPVGVALAVLAVLALVPSRTRIPVLVCWVVALVSAVTGVLLSRVGLELVGTESGVGLGAVSVVLPGALLVAAAIGLQGLVEWRRRVGVLVLVAAAVVPLLGLAWFAGFAEHDLTDERADPIPAYMLQSALIGPEHGVLVVRGSVVDGLVYDVRRDDGATVGEDEVLALRTEDQEFARDVTELLSRPTPGLVGALADHGIEYVVMPSPADGVVAAGLDATGGLSPASAEDRSTRAWKVERPLDPEAVAGSGSWIRVVLLVLQGLAVVVVAVLAAPTARRGR